MIRYTRVFIFAMLLVPFGCDSPDAFDCAKKAGDMVEEEIFVEEFDRIFIQDNLQLNIASGEQQKVVVRGGKNLIPGVNFNLEDKNLTISNSNSCNWARNYDPIIITITTNQLKEIESSGFGLVKSINTLKFEELTLESKDGSADFELSVMTDMLTIINNSISNMRISGNSNSLAIGHLYNDGRFDGSGLEVNTVSITHRGVNDIHFIVNERLSGKLTSRGNIVYFGNPKIVDVAVSGSGQLIKK